MKKLVTLALVLFASSNLFADGFKISCTDKYQKALDFNLDLGTNTIYFTDIGAFGRGEMVTRKYIGITQDYDKNSISFTYNWYFQTTGTFNFEKRLEEYDQGDHLVMKMDFDDGDGIFTYDEELNCVIKKKKVENFQ